MSVLNQDTSNSRGGICSDYIEMTFANQTMDFPDLIEGELKTEIQLFFGGTFEKFYFIKDTFRMREKPIRIGDDDAYEQTMQMVASKDSFERIQQLLITSRNEWIGKFEDRNGNTKVFGRPNQGAIVEFERDIKTLFTERNEMLIQIRCQSRYPIPTYTFT